MTCKIGFTLICLLLFQGLSAQKKVIKNIDAFGIGFLEVMADKVFDIGIIAVKSSTITITTWTEGEHNEQLLITANGQGDKMTIGCEYQPEFRNFNDKLSAHKIISVKMKLEVPENLVLYLSSEIANARIQGKFKMLTAELKSGFCILKDFYGNAIANTYNGDIVMETNFASVVAETKNGKLLLDAIVPGPHNIELKSVNGSITVTKTQ